MKKIGLILIGGSLKGIYGHVGILNALVDLRIKPDVILGASAGSIVASFHAVGLSLSQMIHLMTTLQKEDYIDLTSKFRLLTEFAVKQGRNFTGFLNGDKLEHYVQKNLLPFDDFSKTKIPLYIATTNLSLKKLVIFKDGTISDKVRASTAIPMLFKPKKLGTDCYVDGAFSADHLPYELLKLHPDLDMIIVSNFSSEEVSEGDSWLKESSLPLFAIIKRTLEVAEHITLPDKINDTQIIQVHPKILTPVSIFHPDKNLAMSVYNQSRSIGVLFFTQKFNELGLL